VFVISNRELIAQLHAEGCTAIEIARRLRLAEPTVTYHLDRLRAQESEGVTSQVVDIDCVRSRVRTRETVAALLAQGLSKAEVAKQLGVSRSTVWYHARRLGVPIDERGARRYDWDAVQQFYDAGHSVRECVATFGFSHETWQAARTRGAIVTRPQRTPSELMFSSGQLRNRANVKRRLLVEGIKAASCANCGISEWRGERLSLALHHINGDRLDNRIENLELLCPNCHSQTDNYSGRNGRSRTREALS
jgi:DNA-binding CsgD family transcriptional regulator/5-methylcytosine-specific restriction endonuclease McrA